MREDVLELAPQSGARFAEGTELARLIDTLAQAYYRLDTDIGQLRKDRYVETATGKELGRRALPLGVSRPAGESDETFRLRALAGRARSTSDTTFEDFADAVLEVLQAEPGQVELEVDYEDELGAIIVLADNSVYDDSPFSEATIARLLEGAIQMDRRVVLRRQDGFQFSLDSTAGQKTGKGWGEGVWTE